MTEDSIWNLFSRNWVFRLYSRSRKNFGLIFLTAVCAAFIPWILGAIISLFARNFVVYASNTSLYLNLGGFALSLISFGWFAHKLPRVLIAISGAFEISEDDYLRIIEKWADRIANKNYLMVLFTIPIAVLNLLETIAMWRSQQPPILLVSWINSSTPVIFGIIYGYMHAIIVPFFLVSGIIGLIGAMYLIADVMKIPMKLSFYRRLGAVTEMITWLVMWAFIGLASIVILGRPLVLNRLNVQTILVSGIAQSVLGVIVFLIIGTRPFIYVHSAVATAKQEKMEQLEQLHERISSSLLMIINSSSRSLKSSGEEIAMEEMTQQDAKTQVLYKRLDVINALIAQTKAIPDLPVSIPGVVRVFFGALLYLGSTAFKVIEIMNIL